MLRLVFVVIALASSIQVRARHVYPFQYQGVMPSMVRMVDDPRQVGTDDEVIIPPRYTARNGVLKTHDFYPQDEPPVLQNRNVGSFLPSPVQVPVQGPVQAPFRNPGFAAVQPESVVPIFSQDPDSLYPDYQFGAQLQCTSVGANKNEAMDQWCTLNCNHVPSFCPPSHCTCDGEKKKKKK